MNSTPDLAYRTLARKLKTGFDTQERNLMLFVVEVFISELTVCEYLYCFFFPIIFFKVCRLNGRPLIYCYSLVSFTLVRSYYFL